MKKTDNAEVNTNNSSDAESDHAVALSSLLYRTCNYCGHRKGYYCMLSGYCTMTERRHPTVCGSDYKNWIPRLGLFQRIKKYFIGAV